MQAAFKVQPIDNPPTRPWYRLHWLTWVAIAVELAALVHCQRSKQFATLYRNASTSTGMGTYYEEYYFGWPVIFGIERKSGQITVPPAVDRPTFDSRWHFPYFAIDCVLCLLLFPAVIWFIESCSRRPKPWQFSLRGAFAWMVVVGILLTLVKQRIFLQAAIGFIGLPPGKPFEIDDFRLRINALEWASIVVMLFAIGCIVRYLIALASRMFTFLAE